MENNSEPLNLPFFLRHSAHNSIEVIPNIDTQTVFVGIHDSKTVDGHVVVSIGAGFEMNLSEAKALRDYLNRMVQG